jgi:CheY-like chemotaxis protein
MPINVLIVDDHPVVRRGLRVLLEVQDGIEVAGEAGDGPAALALAAELKPDVILLDLKLPGLDGLAVLAELHNTAAKVLILTSVTDPVAAGRAMREGAAGVLYKDVDPDARSVPYTTATCCSPPRRPGPCSSQPPGRTAAWTPSPPASARSWPNWPRAAPTARSPGP